LYDLDQIRVNVSKSYANIAFALYFDKIQSILAMRKKIIALLLPFYLVFNASAQELIDSEFLLGINQATIQAIAGFEVENAVDLFKLKYSTLDLESKVDTASGKSQF